jgi:hypothetical protein
LLASTAKKGKVRPILNLSAPKKLSYNDAIDKNKILKISMSSVTKFSQAIKWAGINATFSKQDIIDAYKLVPCAENERRHFGFKWLGKFFTDISTPFGSKTAPANFDCVGETIVNIVKTKCEVPENCVFRQLDDVPIVSPAGSRITEHFTTELRKFCQKINVPLAPYCPKNEKAFGPSTRGTVLGIEFDSSKMTWRLPEEKRIETLQLIKKFLDGNSCSLLQFQKLHGKLNSFRQLFIFLKGFRFHQIKYLKEFASKNSTRLEIPESLKREIWVWAKVLMEPEQNFPIPDLTKNPNIFARKFISDAAGLQTKTNNENGKSGVASVGFYNDSLNFVASILWPNDFLLKIKGNSTLLEAIGLLLPFLCIPKELVNKTVILFVDNIAVVYSWDKKLCKKDEKTATIIQALHILEALLPCKIFVEHQHRRSTKEAVLADNLTRISTTTTEVKNQIKHLKFFHPKSPINQWLKNPVPNWDLPLLIADFVLSLLNTK